MSYTEEIKEAIARRDAANDEAIGLTKLALKTALLDVFEGNTEIESIVFGVSSQVQNDEQYAQGMYGPIFNENHDDFYRDGEEVDDLFQSYDPYRRDTKEQDALSKLFSEVGWEQLGEALGMSMPDGSGYSRGEATMFTAMRKADGSISLTQDDAGY